MRIGVLADSASVTAKTVRFYEQAGLLPEPPRTPAGYRDYPPEAVDRLVFIREAAAAGLTLAEIAGVLAIRDAGSPPCHHVAGLIDSHLEQVERRIAELLATRAALRNLRERAQAVDPAACTEDDICTILTPRTGEDLRGTA